MTPQMTPELFWLTLTALLAASLWVPYVVISAQPGNKALQSFDRMTPVWQMSDTAQRAYRAHLNLIEQFLPFAALLLIAHLAGVSTTATIAASVAFFWIRLAHAIGFISGTTKMPLRPILFTAGWLCCLVVAVDVLRSM